MSLKRLSLVTGCMFMMMLFLEKEFCHAKEDCRKAWASLINKNLHNYDFKKDGKYTDKGNFGYNSYAARVNRKNCEKDWTVLVYMAADNNLSFYSHLDLYEMQAGYKSSIHTAGSTLKSDWLVQWDTLGDQGIRRLHLFQDPEPYNLELTEKDFKGRTEKNVKSPIVLLFHERLESESKKFKKFLEWGIENYPARHYMVIIWGHGQGWTSFAGMPKKPSEEGTPASTETPSPEATSPFAGRKFGGLAFDETSGTYLDIPSLAKVLKDVSARKLGNRPFDVYASDACLMQMAEVAYEIAPIAKYIVGSTVVQDFLGLPYRRFMYEMNSGAFNDQHSEELKRRGVSIAEAKKSKLNLEDKEARWIANMLPELFLESMDPSRGLQGRMSKDSIKSITMSSIDSEKLLKEFGPAMGELGKAITAYILQDITKAGQVFQVFSRNPTLMGGAQDLGYFLYELETVLKFDPDANSETDSPQKKTANDLRSQMASVKSLLGNVILKTILGTNYDERLKRVYLGFSIWAPANQKSFEARYMDFWKSSFYQTMPTWGNWLRELFPINP